MLPLQVWVKLIAMVIKGHSTFLKAAVLLEPQLLIVRGGVLLLCSDAVGLFFSTSRLGHWKFWLNYIRSNAPKFCHFFYQWRSTYSHTLSLLKNINPELVWFFQPADKSLCTASFSFLPFLFTANYMIVIPVKVILYCSQIS